MLKVKGENERKYAGMIMQVFLMKINCFDKCFTSFNKSTISVDVFGRANARSARFKV